MRLDECPIADARFDRDLVLDAGRADRKTLGSGHAGLGHVGVRTCSVARLGAARMACCGRGTDGGAAE